MDLATDLRSAGVDAILDKWDLREGQESSAFMEQMVTDKEIQKVIIVSDRAYAEKSDSRSGGAGTEAQIISPKLYSGEDEGKFVALVFERDEQGKVCLPAYYTSRICIDFTDLTTVTDSFEQLVRWIFDKPLHRKPDIGRAPAYLSSDEATITLATSAGPSESNGCCAKQQTPRICSNARAFKNSDRSTRAVPHHRRNRSTVR